MSHELPLLPGEDAFPTHVFDLFGQEPTIYQERLGGSVLVVEKRPVNGPITVITSGVSRLATNTGERVELAVEVLDGQQGAAVVALRLVCDEIATNRHVPPVGMPWRNAAPFLSGTSISAIVATGSRWGTQFDDVRNESGELVGHVRTLRLLTDEEANIVVARGWPGLVTIAGSVDAVLDVTRAGVSVPTYAPPTPTQPLMVPDQSPVVQGRPTAQVPQADPAASVLYPAVLPTPAPTTPQPLPTPAPATPQPPAETQPTGLTKSPGAHSLPSQSPERVAGRTVILTKFHDVYPPRWVSLNGGMFQSVTGAESAEYMADSTNHEMCSEETYLARFPWTAGFLRVAYEGQTACFSDATGGYVLEP